MTLYEELKQYLIDEIEGYEGQMVYGADLANLLTEGPNMNGTVEFSTYATIEKIKENWDEYGSVYKYMIDNFGEPFNVFDSPESFDVWAYYIIAGEILSKIPFIEENWNNKIELNFDNIELIQEAIENDETGYFEY